MSEMMSPLARLVLFMVCLSVAGAFVAGVHYLAIDLPQQKSGTPPSNACLTVSDSTMRLMLIEGYDCSPHGFGLWRCCK